MERIRIRSMLNYLKKAQTIESDLKLLEIQPKSSTEDSASQIISHSSREKEAENTHFHKYSGFTLDSSQLDLSIYAQNVESGSSEELSNSVLLSEIRKKKTPVKCLINGLNQRKRSSSQNLQELGIAKKALSSRKYCQKNISNSNLSGQSSGKISQEMNNSNEWENFRRAGHSQGKNILGQRLKQKIIIQRNNDVGMRDTKKAGLEGQVRIRNLKCKEKGEKCLGNRQQGISPWTTQQQSTNLYYTIQ